MEAKSAYKRRDMQAKLGPSNPERKHCDLLKHWMALHALILASIAACVFCHLASGITYKNWSHL
eukprot:3135058-Amphidinium_carterae.1